MTGSRYAKRLRHGPRALPGGKRIGHVIRPQPRADSVVPIDPACLQGLRHRSRSRKIPAGPIPADRAAVIVEPAAKVKMDWDSLSIFWNPTHASFDPNFT